MQGMWRLILLKVNTHTYSEWSHASSNDNHRHFSQLKGRVEKDDTPYNSSVKVDLIKQITTIKVCA